MDQDKNNHFNDWLWAYNDMVSCYLSFITVLWEANKTIHFQQLPKFINLSKQDIVPVLVSISWYAQSISINSIAKFTMKSDQLMSNSTLKLPLLSYTGEILNFKRCCTWYRTKEADTRLPLLIRLCIAPAINVKGSRFLSLTKDMTLNVSYIE